MCHVLLWLRACIDVSEMHAVFSFRDKAQFSLDFEVFCLSVLQNVYERTYCLVVDVLDTYVTPRNIHVALTDSDFTFAIGVFA